MYYGTENALKSGMRPTWGTILSGMLWLTQWTSAQAGQQIYTDTLANGWQNWSWATVNFANLSPVHSGSSSISVSAAAWQAVYLEHAALDVSP